MIELKIEIRVNIIPDPYVIDGFEWAIFQRNDIGESWNLVDEFYGIEHTLEAAGSKAIQAFKVLQARLNN
jgi:hypothetical protein